MIDVHCPKGGRHEFEPAISYEWQRFRCVKCHEDWEVGTTTAQLLNAAMQLTADEAEAEAVSLKLQDYANIAGQWRYTESQERHVRLVEFARRWRGDTVEAQDE